MSKEIAAALSKGKQVKNDVQALMDELSGMSLSKTWSPGQYPDNGTALFAVCNCHAAGRFSSPAEIEQIVELAERIRRRIEESSNQPGILQRRLGNIILQYRNNYVGFGAGDEEEHDDDHDEEQEEGGDDE